MLLDQTVSATSSVALVVVGVPVLIPIVVVVMMVVGALIVIIDNNSISKNDTKTDCSN